MPTSPTFQAAVTALVAIRKHRNLTQRDVAALMGTSQGSVSSIEDPHGNTTVKTLTRYADAVGADLKLVVSIR